MFRALFFLLSCFAFFSLVSAEEIQFDENTPVPDITNSERLIQQLHLKGLKGRFSRKLKIAVFDNGFGGYKAQIDKSLPTETFYEPGVASGADRVKFASLHGTLMAKILAHVLKISGVQADYELHLFNTFGYTKFKAAIERVIADRYDLVLFAQTWETGGNVDTHGFINALVTKAVDAGIIWINASGEHGGEMRVDPIQLENRGGEQWIAFKNKKGETKEGLTLNCRLPQCKLELTALWNDVDDNPDIGTSKDLDMFLYDEKGGIVTSAQRRQNLATDPHDANISIIPREVIKWDIKNGTYVVKFKAHAGQYDASKDVVRTMATGPGIQLDDASYDETLFPPADNLKVISVGASDDPTSSRSTKLNRPDVYLTSHIDLKGKNNLFGYSSSMASALAAGYAALKLGTGTAATRDAILAELKKVGTDKAPKVPVAVAAKPSATTNKPSAPPARPTTSPAPAPTSASTSRCYQVEELPYYYRAVNRLIESGGKPIRYHGRLLVAVTSEYARRNNLNRAGAGTNMWYFITPEGIQAFSGDDIRAGLPQEYYLIGYTDIPLCH